MLSHAIKVKENGHSKNAFSWCYTLFLLIIIRFKTILRNISTCILIGILCLLCLFNHGNTTLDAQQITSIQIEVSDLDPNWRPEVNNSLTFEISVTVPADFSSGMLVAELLNVTTYPGASGNMYSVFEHYGEDSDDLGFFVNIGWTKPDDNNKRKLSYNISETGTVSLTVLCRDYAAYGELQLTASGSDGASTPVTYTSNTVTVKIPRDENGNKIADGWRNDATVNYGRDDDNDSGINSNYGDNITVLNEYRGLYVNGAWTDTDPNAWDVFVQSNAGIGGATTLPMTIHQMSSSEVTWDGGQVYDFEIERESGDTYKRVYAIRLTNDPMQLSNCYHYQGTALGEMGLGPPSSNTRGCIFTSRISKHIGAWGIGDTTGFTNSIIAHEIGHGVSLHHCPDYNNPNCYMWEVGDGVNQFVTQFACHHDQDYALSPTTSGPQSPAGGFRPYRKYISASGFYTIQREDVNLDGVVNILDLIYVVSRMGSTAPTTADVNRDGIVDIIDLLYVTTAF